MGQCRTRAHRQGDQLPWQLWLLVVCTAPGFSPPVLYSQTAPAVATAPLSAATPSVNAQEVSARDVEPNFQLKSESNAVTVRVIVRDRGGTAVGNLRQEDFQVYDRGKKQTITHFSVERPAAPPTAPAASIAQGTSAPPGSAQPSTSPASARHFVALFFDDVNTELPGLARSRDAAERFLQSSLHSDDRVGIFTASGLKPLDFTSDLARVRQALADLRPHPVFSEIRNLESMQPYQAYLIAVRNDPDALALAIGQIQQTAASSTSQSQSNQASQPSPAQVIDPFTSEAGRDALATAQRIHSETESRSRATLEGIKYLVGLMSRLSGERSLVIISDGFLSQTLGDSLNVISDRALRANVVISALDARGLFLSDAVSDASVAGRDMPEDTNLKRIFENILKEQAMRETEGMGTLAQNTGGILYENNNDLDAGFRQVTALPDTEYTLVFSPQDLKHDGSFHPLKVTLASKGGFTVQARKGYYAPRTAEDTAIRENEDLQDSVFSQDVTQTVPIQVETQFFKVNESDTEIDVLTHVDLRHLRFRKEGDRNRDELTFVTALFDRDGHYVTGQQKYLELRLRDVNMEKYMRTGVKVESNFHVKAGTYMVRAVVQEAAGGQISAQNRTIEIPY